MDFMAIKCFQVIKTIIAINFYISAILLIFEGFMSVFGTTTIFQFNEELYGALDNNLRMVMIYLALSEALIVAFCIFSKKFQVMIIVGSLLILMIGSLAFYSEINEVEIDPNLSIFFLYTGVSHIIFGALANIRKNITETLPKHF